MAELESFKLKGTILDGEVVYLVKGRSDFQRLQNAIKGNENAPLFYYVFDLLKLHGKDMTELPLVQRKELLHKLLKNLKTKTVRFNEHMVDKGEELYKLACQQNLEGIISKRKDAPYEAGRGRSWVKVKCQNEQEFVIAGYTESDKGAAFRSLLLGVHDKDGRLIYAGKVGGGFTQKSLNEVSELLFKHETKKCPFAQPPSEKKAHWLKPKYLAQVKFAEWTDEGSLRQPIFLGIRADKAAKNITRDEPASLAPAKKTTKKTTKKTRKRTSTK